MESASSTAKDRRRTQLLVAALAAILYMAPPGMADEPGGWEGSYAAGKRSYEHGQYDAARATLEDALVQANAQHADPARKAALVNDIGFCCLMQGQIAKAESLFQESLDMRRKALGNSHPQVAQSYNNLGGFYFAQGDLAQADLYLGKAAAVWKVLHWPDSPDANLTVKNYRAFLEKVGKGSEATALTQEVTVARSGAMPPQPEPAKDSEHWDWSSYTQAAVRAAESGDYAEAERLLKRQIDLALEHKVAKSDPAVSEPTRRLSELLIKQKRYAEAAPYLQTTIAHAQGGAGDSADDLAASLKTLADTNRQLGQTAACEDSYRRAVDVLEARYGRNCRQLIPILVSYAAFARENGRWGWATYLEQKAAHAQDSAIQESRESRNQRIVSLRRKRT